MIREYGYEYDAVRDETAWHDTQGRVTDQKLLHAHCLRSGRDALKAIAREYKPCEVLLPALSCDSMAYPFEQYGHKINYYRLNPDYSIDLNSLPSGGDQMLFLYMAYFGCPAISDDALREFRAKGNVVFIEDRTHDLIWNRTSNFQPDYIMASLRKWLPLPDGGLLWGTIGKPLGDDVSFANIRLKAQCMRNAYLRCGDESIKTEYRKVFSTVSDIIDRDSPGAMSAYSYALAEGTDWTALRMIRKRNAEVLIRILTNSPYITLIQNKVGKSDLYVAFTVPNRDEIQRRLSAEGIYNTIIWPLTEEQKNTCAVAAYTADHMLAAPCDQRYTTDDMRYIGTEIVKVVSDVNQ